MNAETLVLLLEEHIADIKQNLEASLWPGFVATLARVTEEVQPKKEALERWADRVCDLLMGCSYTKGLLQGLKFQVGLNLRSLPSRVPCPDPGPSIASSPARPDDAALVTRIRAVVQRARVLG